MRQFILALGLLLSFSMSRAQAPWQLVWSDEFNASKQSKVDGKYWTLETGGWGWGNSELEYYTDSINNAYQDGTGNLVIKAIQEKNGKTCWYGACQYTSARMISKAKFERTYGRFGARIRIRYGQGIWPAFWLLGANISSVNWPRCGEIDIMENIGREPSTVHGTIHGPGYSGAGGIGAALTSVGRFADQFHVYALEWEENTIRWYVDDVLYQTRTPKDLPEGSAWVFDHPFFIILNVAVGGGWPGRPDTTTRFPQSMKVDYVRVYAR